jgi:hypothetical protein
MKDYEEFQHFLKGGSIPKTNNEKLKRSENEDFVSAYTKLISQSQNETVPEFDAFEKVNQKRKTVWFYKLIPYAAVFTLLLIVTSIWFFNLKRNDNSLTEKQQILETRQNIEFALLHFSKELNTCIAKFEDAKKMHQPFTEMTLLKNYEVDFNNPMKNLKIN